MWKHGSLWCYGNLSMGTLIAARNGNVTLVFDDVKITLTEEKARLYLRPPIQEGDLPSILGVLSAPSTPHTKSWVNRVRAYKDIIRLGLPDELASMYRDLARKSVLTFSEKRFFREVEKRLLAELRPHWGEAVESRLQEAAQCSR